ncbi:MAG: winged helix-turn-helix domain-containing protein, partial [Halobacteriaceae archaeon]
MTEENSTDSPLAAVAGSIGSDAANAFELLGDTTRLAILLALWDVHEPATGETPLSFSDLYDKIDYDHPGNFSYHIKQLTGQFIRKTERGYELKHTGKKVVQAVISRAGFDPPTYEQT